MNPNLYALLSVFVVSLASFAGAIVLAAQREYLRRIIFVLVSLAIGALLGDAIIHLIPEAFESGLDPRAVSIAILAGILAFFVLEKVLAWHHGHGEDDETSHTHPLGRLILISDGLHNFIDGLIIAASYTVSVEVGLATTAAVILHEIPQEIGDFGVLLHAGYSIRKALFANFFSALAAVLGAVVVFVAGEATQSFQALLVPFAAGVFIYIAGTDLIPELHKHAGRRKALLQFIAILAGIGAMFLLTILE